MNCLVDTHSNVLRHWDRYVNIGIEHVLSMGKSPNAASMQLFKRGSRERRNRQEKMRELNDIAKTSAHQKNHNFSSFSLEMTSKNKVSIPLAYQSTRAAVLPLLWGLTALLEEEFLGCDVVDVASHPIPVHCCQSGLPQLPSSFP